MAQNETWLNHDMMNAVKVRYLDGNVFSMDNAGNLIGVLLTKGGVDYSGGGSVSANVIRADGATVAVTGALSGNAATVVLPQAAYAVPGVLSIVIKLTVSGEVTTIGAVAANVYQSSTDSTVDPGTIIPSIETLIAEIEAAVATIPADYSSLWASLAPPFSSSRTYKTGEYTTNEGKLYRFIHDHSGNWNSSDVVEIDLGNQIYTVRTAINDSDAFITPDWVRGTIQSSGAEANSTTRIRSGYHEIRDNMYATINSGYAYEFDWYDLTSETPYLGATGWQTDNKYIIPNASATHFRLLMKKSSGNAIYPYEGANLSINFNIVANGLNSLDTNYYIAHLPDTDNGQVYPDNSTAKTKVIPIKPGHMYNVFAHGGNRRVFGLSNNPAPVVGEIMPLPAYWMSNTSEDRCFQFTNSGNYGYLYNYYQYGTDTVEPYELYVQDVTELNKAVINHYKGLYFTETTTVVEIGWDVEMFVIPVQKNTDYKLLITGGNRRRVGLSNDPYPIVGNSVNKIYSTQGTTDTTIKFNSGSYEYCYVYYYTNTASQTKPGNVFIVSNSEIQNTISESFSSTSQSGQGANTGDVLSVMTYNVYTYQVSTGSETGMPDSKVLEYRKFLGNTNADILCLQECPQYIDTGSTKGCIEYLYYPQYPNVYHRDSWGYSDNVTASKIQAETTGSVKLSQYGGGARSIRYCVFNIGQKKLLVMNSHTSWKDGGGSPTSDGEIAIRLSNFNDIFNWENGSIQLYNMTGTALISVPTHTHCIICMDGNTVTSTDKTNLQSVAGTNNFILGNGGRYGWFYTCDIDNAEIASLDNIMVSNNIIINNIEALSGKFDVLYSDHVPLIANVTLL